MPSDNILRFTKHESVNVSHTAISGSGYISMAAYAAGLIWSPASNGGSTTLTWYHSADGVTFSPIGDGGGNAVTTTIAASTAEWYPLPTQLFASEWIGCINNGSADFLAIIQLKT